jgi:hypothetical protein
VKILRLASRWRNQKGQGEHEMKKLLSRVMRGSLVVAVIGLAGCGGGGSSSSGGGTNSTDTGPLAKYAGTWVQGCNNHNRETTIMTSSNNGSSLTHNSKDEYFANADCTGAIVATGTYESPPYIIQSIETVTNATVRMLTGGIISATVDRVTSTNTGSSIKYVGSGVTSSTVIGNKTYTHIVFNNGSTDLQSDNSSGGGQGALLLLNGELLVLNPVSNSLTSFDVFSRYIH